MKDIVAEAYQLINSIDCLNRALPDVAHGIRIEDYHKAQDIRKEILNISIRSPKIFYQAIDDALMDSDRYRRLTETIKNGVRDYLTWYSKYKNKIKKQSDFTALISLAEKEGERKFAHEASITRERLSYWRKGDLDVIRSFTRSYFTYYGEDFYGPKGPKGEDAQHILNSAREMISYFSRETKMDFKIPDQFKELYDWYYGGYREELQKRETAHYEVLEQKRDYISSVYKSIDGQIFQSLNSILEDFVIEVEPITKNIDKGRKKTKERYDSFKGCFCNEKDFNLFIKVAEEYASAKNITMNDCASVFQLLFTKKVIKPEVKKSNFAPLFHQDFPNLYTNTSNNISAKGYSEFEGFIRKHFKSNESDC